MKKFMTILVWVWSFSVSQEYQIRSYQMGITQSPMVSDSLSLKGAIGRSPSQTSSSESLELDGGFIKVLNNTYKQPPVLSTFISDTLKNDGMPVFVRAIATDINGIDGTSLFIQQGGSAQSIEFEMYPLNDSLFQVMVPDSFLTVRNFRAWVVTVDGMSYEATSDYSTPVMSFSVDSLSMDNPYSYYPDGVDPGHWRLISWPGELENDTLKIVSMKDHSYIFWDLDLKTSEWVKPRTIKVGKGYWFKHKFADNTIFSNHNTPGASLPLLDHEIILSPGPGWNIIGNPFSFPADIQYDSVNVSGLYFYGYDSTKNSDGWWAQKRAMNPWAGYMVYNYSESSQVITVKAFNNEYLNENSNRSFPADNWEISLHLDGKNYFDYSGLIGRSEYAKEERDGSDIPSLPNLDDFVSLSMKLEDDNDHAFSSDIRSTNEFNGIWNLRLTSKGDSGPYTVEAHANGILPEELVVKVIDIQSRVIYDDFLVDVIDVNKTIESGYDLILVSGDEGYVNEMVQKIFAQIPAEYSLGQNYPNPFNPITKIDFALPRTGRVVVTVYNMLGQEVRQLVNDRLDYGFHTVTWKGLDRMGRPVASGVYFSELRAEGFRKTRKMLLLK